MLTGGSRTALPRHRTLRAVVEWSWDLLSEDERRLARRLAVFVGGITAVSAADICASSELPQDLVEDLLGSLVDKSLLQLVADEGRYRMLETLREFGLERMAELGEVTTIRSAHARYFAALAAHADPMLRTRDQLIWLDLLNAERDNIVAALRYLADGGEVDAALDVALAMNWFWVLTGRHSEAATWTRFAMAAGSQPDPVKRLVAEALVAINSASTMWTDDPAEVKGRMDGIASINQRLDDVTDPDLIHPLVRVLRPVMAMLAEDVQLAERLVEDGLRSADAWTIATVRVFRAAIAENEGDAAKTRVDASQSLAELRDIGERWGMGNCLQLLAPLNTMEGNLELAAANYREALELFGALGALEDEGLIRVRLADVLFRQGDVDGARGQLAAAMRHSETSVRPESLFGGFDRESLLALATLADIERLTGNREQARRLRDESLQLTANLAAPHPAQGHISAMVYGLAAKIDIADGELPRCVRAARSQLRDGDQDR